METLIVRCGNFKVRIESDKIGEVPVERVFLDTVDSGFDAGLGGQSAISALARALHACRANAIHQRLEYRRLALSDERNAILFGLCGPSLTALDDDAQLQVSEQRLRSVTAANRQRLGEIGNELERVHEQLRELRPGASVNTTPAPADE